MTSLSWLRLFVVGCLSLAEISCGKSAGTAGGGGGKGGTQPMGGTPGSGGRGSQVEDGVAVAVTVPTAKRDAVQAQRTELAQGRPTNATQFSERWRPTYLDKLPYDPTLAVNLPLIQGTSLKLNPTESGVLAKKGFVISGRQQFPTFSQGYVAIYAGHLPLFVSADSVMHAVHRSYDAILMQLENLVLIAKLEGLLTTMHTALPAMSAGWSAEVVRDVDEYLTVGRQLLGTAAVSPLAGGDPRNVAALVMGAQAGMGIATTALFGGPRDMDFSQFQPRGHYAGDSRLEKYFRASMWLGRTDLRLLQQKTSGQVLFNRRQFAAALLLSRLVVPASAQWQALDTSLRAFVGESDNMKPADFGTLATALGVAKPEDVLGKTDQEIAQALLNGDFGIQRIASQLLVVEPGNEGAPLDRAFLLLGQRYVIDSHVLSNVVYDRVEMRLMPSPLDVAFGALRNARAAELLAPDLALDRTYPSALHDSRVLVDKHEAPFWQASLYGSWLAALRAIAPPLDASRPQAAGLPAVTGTEAWSRRLLNTQLASWTELRHDTLLYAKQSYTGIPACEFPDAYVEPTPAFWAALVDFARRGTALLGELGVTSAVVPDVSAYFSTLEATASMLKGMADSQVAGRPFTGEQMAFINTAVEIKNVSIGSGSGQRAVGWYPQLFYKAEDANKSDTIVADVHTQPADGGGNIIGHVLHVGTGYPRLMVTTFDTCNGPRAYVGLVSSYFETITKDFDRLTDARWTGLLESSTRPPEVPWMSDLVAR